MASKKWSAITWFVVVAPLVAFLVLTIWVTEILIKLPGWQLVPYIVVAIAVIFLIIGSVFRAKWGKFTFG